nr:uncharacterized protein CI109_007004 [Kwoniella shandongensis]KAA5524681.1 hypothetical protein CI109_007004 [Kwoniella shandongensis]
MVLFDTMDFSSDLDNLGLPFPPDPNNQPQYDIDPSMEDPLSHALSSNNSTANSAFNSPPDLQTINSPWTSNHEPTFDQHYADLGEGRFLTQGPPYQIGPTDVITSPLNALTYHPFIPYMRPHILSHASSNSSLMSFASSYGGNLNGMPVEGLATEQTINISPNYSRHSSYSTPLMLDHTPCQTAPVPEMDIDTFPQNDHNNDLELTTPVGHPITTSALRDLPKLAVQTQGLGKAIKMRERSASRSMPYLRHRSESVSMTSEKGDDQSEMHSAATFFSAAPSPWSTLTPCSISAPLGDLTLQLKRANSDASLNSLSRSSAAPQSTRPVLSRSRRSSSLLVKSYQRESGIRLLVGEQEVEIRQQLATKAAEIDTLMETQRDKARTAWVKQWSVCGVL